MHMPVNYFNQLSTSLNGNVPTEMVWPGIEFALGLQHNQQENHKKTSWNVFT
jgi:hypothetical protein